MNRRHDGSFRIAAFVLAAVIALGCAPALPARAELAGAAALTAAPTAAAAVDTYDENNPQDLTEEDIRGAAAIVMDSETGDVLFQKNADEILYPASTTKIMTCLLALEYGELDKAVKVPKQITKLPKDSSLVPLKAGEKTTLRDLLYGLMLRSGNDAAVTIAVAVSGSVSKFVDKMNRRAQELGCTNTNFKNPHGYHNKAHYSTARDLAIIAQEAMKNEEFRKIVSATSYTLAKTNKHKKRKITTSDAMLVESSPHYYPYEIGIKTGYHSKAGQCFVGAAEKDGATLIAVTLKSSKNGRWTDTRRLMEYGFYQLSSELPGAQDDFGGFDSDGSQGAAADGPDDGETAGELGGF